MKNIKNLLIIIILFILSIYIFTNVPNPMVEVVDMVDQNILAEDILVNPIDVEPLKDGNNIVFISTGYPNKIILGKYNPEEKALYEKHTIGVDYKPETGQSSANRDHINYNSKTGDIKWLRSSSRVYGKPFECGRFLENGSCVPEGQFKNNIYEPLPSEVKILSPEKNSSYDSELYSDSYFGIIEISNYHTPPKISLSLSKIRDLSIDLPVLPEDYRSIDYLLNFDNDFDLSNNNAHIINDGKEFLYTSRKDKEIKRGELVSFETYRINLMNFREEGKETLVERSGKGVYLHIVSISPDGKYILFKSNVGFEILNRDTEVISVVDIFSSKKAMNSFSTRSIHWE